MGKIIVASYRRSGTHLAIETLNKNFEIYLSEQTGNKTHLFYEDLKEKLDQDDTVLYIIRDVRDVLLSCYEWWNISNESMLSNIKPHFKGKTFDQFLRGKIEVPNFIQGMVTNKEHQSGIITDPVKFWEQHVKSYLHGVPKGKLVLFHYEDLKNLHMIKRLGKSLNLKLKTGLLLPLPVNIKVGYSLDAGTEIFDNTQKWKKVYNDEQIEYVNGKVGDFLELIGYPRGR